MGKKVVPQVVAATEGMMYLAKRHMLPGRELKGMVGPTCGMNHGGWFCITCDLSFRNNLEKDSHILQVDGHKPKPKDGKHVLAWVCYEHGVEVP